MYVSTGMEYGWRELYNVIYDKVQIRTFYVRNLLSSCLKIIQSVDH